MICAYASIENNEIIEYPIYQGDLKALVGYDDNSEIPFECPEGYVEIEDAIPPPYPTDYTKVLVEKTPEQINGVWTRVWAIEDASEEEINFRIQKQSDFIREQRNRLLFQSDWTQLRDVEVNDDISWRIYRQELRDIPSQEGFPWNVSWPEIPN